MNGSRREEERKTDEDVAGQIDSTNLTLSYFRT